MAEAIVTENLVRVFKLPKNREVRALDGVEIKVREGEIFGLLGPNGAGKTTLIKILATLLLPTAGRAWVGGFDVIKSPQRVREIINLVSGGETPGYGLLSVWENLWFFSQLYGLRGSEAKRVISRLIEEVGLEEYAHTRMHRLSTGFKQRLNLARGFINNPRVLFLDEPTLGLDVLSARHIREYVKRWIDEDPSRTVLLTTHYMAEAEELCDRVAIIDRGRIVACDSPLGLKSLVRRERVVRLEVAGVVGSVDRIRGMAGVRGVGVETRASRGTTTLRVVLGDGTIDRLLRTLSDEGLRLVSVTDEEPTLEDVYITLVGRGLEGE